MCSSDLFLFCISVNLCEFCCCQTISKNKNKILAMSYAEGGTVGIGVHRDQMVIPMPRVIPSAKALLCRGWYRRQNPFQGLMAVSCRCGTRMPVPTVTTPRVKGCRRHREGMPRGRLCRRENFVGPRESFAEDLCLGSQPYADGAGCFAEGVRPSAKRLIPVVQKAHILHFQNVDRKSVV